MDFPEAPNGWPDAQQCGVPRNPDQDGTHLLMHLETGVYVLGHWCAARKTWSHALLRGHETDAREVGDQYEYCEPGA